MKHILSSVVSLLLFCSFLTACGSEAAAVSSGLADSTPDTTAEETVKEPTVSETVTETYKDYDYDGYEFRFYSLGAGKHFYHKISEEANEVYFENDSGDVLNSAIYMRNLQTEQLLNINISAIWGGNWNELNDQVSKIILSGEDAFDCLLGALSKNIELAAQHEIVDLMQIGTLDTSHAWWDQEIVNHYLFNGKLFTLTGHYNIFDEYAVPVIFYNQTVCSDFNLEDPYDVITGGKWTLDYMMETAEAVTADINGDGEMTLDDRWGFMDNSDCYVHMRGGTGLMTVQRTPEGEYQITLESEQAVNIAKKIYERVACSSAVYIAEKNADCVACFVADRDLYYYELLGAINEFRNMGSDFGVAPLPKYDEAQEEYSSELNSIWCTALSVPVTQTDLDRTGIILDVLGGYSTDTVNDVLFELVLGEKLVRNSESVEMMQLVFSSKRYDLSFGFSSKELYNGMKPDKGFTFVSDYAKKKSSYEKGLANFLASFED